MQQHILQQCWFLAGPTACGKTEIGVRLAERLGAEIVSLDSMALYRGMDIGTAKPSDEARKAVPHHLIDVIDPHEEYTVADYVSAADSVCTEIVNRGRVPLFVGGTGLYLRSLLRGVFEGPSADWEFRKQLEREAAAVGAGELHRRLSLEDPVTAHRLHPNDTRRVIRALEVMHLTGRALSLQQCEPPLPEKQRPRHVFWLDPPREWLYGRINRRVSEMVSNGLIDEVKRLLDAPQPLSRTAGQALGYKEILDSLSRSGTLPETVQRIRTRTRQFAKRQYTWFRNLEECSAVAMTGEESDAEMTERLIQASMIGAR